MIWLYVCILCVSIAFYLLGCFALKKAKQISEESKK